MMDEPMMGVHEGDAAKACGIPRRSRTRHYANVLINLGHAVMSIGQALHGAADAAGAVRGIRRR